MASGKLFQSLDAWQHQDISPNLVVLAFGNVRMFFPVKAYVISLGDINSLRIYGFVSWFTSFQTNIKKYQHMNLFTYNSRCCSSFPSIITPACSTTTTPTSRKMTTSSPSTGTVITIMRRISPTPSGIISSRTTLATWILKIKVNYLLTNHFKTHEKN